MNEKIDFVITWVDENDTAWLNEKNKYTINFNNDASHQRYRDWDFLKYWFRSVEKYASWVNKIFFVTYGHVPKWLNENNEKIVIVKHEDFIPKEYLPTFNSCVIELYLHKIKGLSEKFVYFNDDMFINNYTTEEDFFKDGKPLDNMILTPIHASTEASACIHYNCMKIINKYFKAQNIEKRKLFSIKNGKYLYKNITLGIYPFNVGFRFHHLPTSFLKNTFYEVWKNEEIYLKNVSLNKFRSDKDVSQWIFQFWQLASNKYELRKVNTGKYFSLSNEFEMAISEINKSKCKLICLNDGNIDDFENKKNILRETFDKKYSIKSNFEK